MKIFKYPLKFTKSQSLTLPKDSEILSAQIQDDMICLWAAVTDELATEERTFKIFPTGHSFGDIDKHAFINTVQAGPLVWHIFEELEL
jgi:hypothetical protein